MSDTPSIEYLRRFVKLPEDSATHIENLERAYKELQRENAALRAELEGVRKDAERYRWLRGQNKYRSENVRVQVIQGPNWVYPSNFYLDSAIDAAIAQGKGEK